MYAFLVNANKKLVAIFLKALTNKTLPAHKTAPKLHPCFEANM